MVLKGAMAVMRLIALMVSRETEQEETGCRYKVLMV